MANPGYPKKPGLSNLLNSGQYKSKIRVCLQCPKKFRSTWFGHRICNKCQKKNQALSHKYHDFKDYLAENNRAGRLPTT